MTTSLKLSIMLLGTATILGLACKKPEPIKAPEPAKVDASKPDPEQARLAESARLKAEAERRRVESAQQEAARKAESDQAATFRSAAAGALQDIHFSFDEASLSEPEKAKLQVVAEFLKHYPKTTVQLEGHCDERGTGEYNLALGERRAKAVMAYLKGLGSEEKQMSTTTYGKEKPLCTEATEACWGRNRRVHFHLN